MPLHSIDYERLASELLRTLRGRRSQTALARRLGYKSNVVYSWESGRAYPTAARSLWVASKVGVDVRAALQGFYRRPPEWLEACNLTRPDGVARLLDDLRGRTSITDLARSCGRSRYAVARWLNANTEPRLPDFLRLIESSTLRVLDFLAVLVDPTRLASVAAAWRALEAARRAAYDLPWSQAVLRALELQAYRALAKHEPGWIARRIGISAGEETMCLNVLLESRQVRLQRGKYQVVQARALDTRRDPEAARGLRAFWAEVALERLRADQEGVFAYNLFGVSERDLARVRELQGAYYRELRTLVARSQPVERVVLANLQLVTLG
jgi:transcriptional regulator with XRE-family HTH domain